LPDFVFKQNLDVVGKGGLKNPGRR
jgi:hypothetical protein